VTVHCDSSFLGHNFGRKLTLSDPNRSQRSKFCGKEHSCFMSFQNFRLDDPLPSPATTSNGFTSTAVPPSATTPPSGDAQFNIQLDSGSRGVARGPYGSGDMDDGYTLVFKDFDEFQAWRTKEEEEKTVEFVKGDTHGSRAVPPRFKEHVKLVCARHCRSGRKKYVKKYPERVRKVPSRKVRRSAFCCRAAGY
jgi:hypothetical protein